jgi:hypothetical protein
MFVRDCSLIVGLMVHGCSELSKCFARTSLAEITGELKSAKANFPRRKFVQRFQADLRRPAILRKTFRFRRRANQ